ncbi:MAG TPA: NADH:flavin oxidoreductase/NADH oxidase [Steroidobacteraceae bacterium]|nr:NADH:flavin oxidoreductase/NADH oxidase [Steroidobacteraceae bacterium]
MSSALFSSISFRGLTLPNRIVVSPMCQYASVNGSATDWHLMHLGSLSMGAAGLVMVEMTNVALSGRISARCAALCSDENEAALKRVIDFCRAYGVAKLGIQLAHAGRKGSQQPPAEGGKPLTAAQGAWQTVAPSAIPFGEGWPAPHALTRGEIQQLIADHVQAVQRAQRIGFDVVEMHGAHGYLVHQFLSPLSNHRSDEYGGPLQNRMRFGLETFAAMRAAWPAEKPMGIRVSATDWVEGGWQPEEAVAFARELKALGCDYVDTSSGGLDPRQKIPLAPGYQVPFAERIRREAGIATMSVGLIDKPEQAEQIVSSGQADLVVLARGALYDPRWAWHAAEALGAETQYAPKYRVCHPSLRPELFAQRRRPV